MVRVPSAMRSGLRVGDRVPNFRRHDAANTPHTLYDLCCGQPLWLATSSDDLTAALGLLETAPDDAIAVALVEATPQTLARPPHEAGPLVLADDGQIIRHFLGDSPATAQRLWITDANLRVVQVHDHAPEVQPPARQEDWPAPVLVVPRVFEPAFCQQLIDHFEASETHDSGVYKMRDGEMVWQPDDAVKKRRDLQITQDEWVHPIAQRIQRRLLPEIARVFSFQVTRHEPYKLIRYSADTGGYFRPHRDNASEDSQHRRFAMTLNLNTGQYQGGALHFPEFGSSQYQAPLGGAIIFSCSLAHQALDVTAGTRYALLSFFFSDAQKQRQVAVDDGGRVSVR